MRAQYEGHSATGDVLSAILGWPHVDQEGGVEGSGVVVFLVPETEGRSICDLARCIEDGKITRAGVIRYLQCLELYSGVGGEVEVRHICVIEASEIELDIGSMC